MARRPPRPRSRAPAGDRQRPLTILDGAHNPHAVALAACEALPELVGERPLALVLGVLDDKDAAAMLAGLLARHSGAWFAAPPGPAGAAAGDAPARWRVSSASGRRCGSGQRRGTGAAREWARERGRRGARARARCTWSARCWPRRAERQRVEGAEGERAGSVGARGWSAPVAGVVALVILVFFAAGYGFGRLFL